MPELSSKEYMKQMNRKQKISYIWEYYKLPIIAALIVIIAIPVIIHEHKTRNVYELSLTLIGNSIDMEKQDELADTITSQFVQESSSDSRKKASIDFMPLQLVNGEESLSYEYIQKLTTYMGAGQMDVVIMSEDMFESYASDGIFLSLEDIDVPQGKGYEVLSATDEESGETYAAGIRLGSENSILDDIGYDYQGRVICIILNTSHKEKAKQLVQWIINQ